MFNPNVTGTDDMGMCKPMTDIKAEDKVKILLVKITNTMGEVMGVQLCPVIIIKPDYSPGSYTVRY